MKTIYCEVCLDNRKFNRIKKDEEVTVKGKTFVVTHEYDECVVCGELFEPHEDADRNIKNDFREYRKLVGYLQPEQIKRVRKKYGFNYREYAELLGIGHSTLWHIENGSLQTDYQNASLTMIESPTAMLKLLLERKQFLSFDVEERIKNLESICIEEEPHLVAVKNKVYRILDDHEKKINELKLSANESSKDILKIKENYEEVSPWTHLFSGTIPQS